MLQAGVDSPSLPGEGVVDDRSNFDRHPAVVTQEAGGNLDGLVASAAADTSWRAIVAWYDLLKTIDDSPVVVLNRAAALSEGAHAYHQRRRAPVLERRLVMPR